jgi:hypothetical protein
VDRWVPLESGGVWTTRGPVQAPAELPSRHCSGSRQRPTASRVLHGLWANETGREADRKGYGAELQRLHPQTTSVVMPAIDRIQAGILDPADVEQVDRLNASLERSLPVLREYLVDGSHELSLLAPQSTVAAGKELLTIIKTASASSDERLVVPGRSSLNVGHAAFRARGRGDCARSVSPRNQQPGTVAASGQSAVLAAHVG